MHTPSNPSNTKPHAGNARQPIDIPPLKEELETCPPDVDMHIERTPLPVHSGMLSRNHSLCPVRFRIRSCVNVELLPITAYGISERAFKICCIAFEVVRGRVGVQALRGMVTTTCCERLELMRDLMKSATSSRVDLHSKRFYGQPMPVLIDGTAVSPDEIRNHHRGEGGFPPILGEHGARPSRQCLDMHLSGYGMNLTPSDEMADDWI